MVDPAAITMLAFGFAPVPEGIPADALSEDRHNGRRRPTAARTNGADDTELHRVRTGIHPRQPDTDGKRQAVQRTDGSDLCPVLCLGVASFDRCVFRSPSVETRAHDGSCRAARGRLSKANTGNGNGGSNERMRPLWGCERWCLAVGACHALAH